MKQTGTFDTLIQVQQYFADEAFCRQHLAEQRWGKGPAACHYCGTIGAYVIEGGKRYKCCAKVTTYLLQVAPPPALKPGGHDA